MRILLSFSLLLCLGLISCGPDPKFASRIAELDSLSLQLHTARDLYNTIDSAGAKLIFDEVNKTLGKVNELVKDTLTREQAMLISQYRMIKKPLKEYLQRLPVTQKEIAVTAKQLKDLSHDLSKGLIPEKDADLHVKKESELARLLINTLNMSHESVGMCREQFNALNPRMDSLVKAMEQLPVPLQGK